jgi:hypothetical protein
MYFLLNSDLPTILASEETAIIIILSSVVVVVFIVIIIIIISIIIIIMSSDLCVMRFVCGAGATTVRCAGSAS